MPGAVKWFNVNKGYAFINENETSDYMFLYQTATTRNNPHKIKGSMGKRET